MARIHAVGIDLGTTYSCIACLSEHGEPVTLPNRHGEYQTPSMVLFDGDEVLVGREALRNAVSQPSHVVQNSKRYMGDPKKRWTIAGKSYTPVDIATFILSELLETAREKLGPIELAVITIPTQFTDLQRRATIEAGRRAGLKHVDIINEPVAAALCAVLGSEGLWFAELADAQRILVFDLGGGTFDLSLVRYEKNEVSVLTSGGDLHLGGLDWNQALLDALCDQFAREFGDDPRSDPESLQCLALEVEEVKRSLSVRERAPLTCQHAGHRKIYKIEREEFEQLTRRLVDRAAATTKRMLKEKNFGWAHVDIVMTVGGASRMPMVRNMLKELSGRTLNTSLSPDQSIAHGAAYYAGMLLTSGGFGDTTISQAAAERLATMRQQSVSARSLGILITDKRTRHRTPHYLIDANTLLPVSVKQSFGTVEAGQKRVHVQIVESGTSPEQSYVELGECVIKDLPSGLPAGSRIEITIRYDDQACVHVAAKEVTSGHKATADIVRPENVITRPLSGVVEAVPLDPQGAPIELSLNNQAPERTDERP